MNFRVPRPVTAVEAKENFGLPAALRRALAPVTAAADVNVVT